MRCVPVNTACSAMTREDDNFVGGLGGGGIMDARLLDILVCWRRYVDCNAPGTGWVNGSKVSVDLKSEQVHISEWASSLLEVDAAYFFDVCCR